MQWARQTWAQGCETGAASSACHGHWGPGKTTFLGSGSMLLGRPPRCGARHRHWGGCAPPFVTWLAGAYQVSDWHREQQDPFQCTHETAWVRAPRAQCDRGGQTVWGASTSVGWIWFVPWFVSFQRLWARCGIYGGWQFSEHVSCFWWSVSYLCSVGFGSINMQAWSRWSVGFRKGFWLGNNRNRQRRHISVSPGKRTHSWAETNQNETDWSHSDVSRVVESTASHESCLVHVFSKNSFTEIPVETSCRVLDTYSGLEKRQTTKARLLNSRSMLRFLILCFFNVPRIRPCRALFQRHWEPVEVVLDDFEAPARVKGPIQFEDADAGNAWGATNMADGGSASYARRNSPSNHSGLKTLDLHPRRLRRHWPLLQPPLRKRWLKSRRRQAIWQRPPSQPSMSLTRRWRSWCRSKSIRSPRESRQLWVLWCSLSRCCNISWRTRWWRAARHQALGSHNSHSRCLWPLRASISGRRTTRRWWTPTRGTYANDFEVHVGEAPE